MIASLASLPECPSEQAEWFHALARAVDAAAMSPGFASVLTPEVAAFVNLHLPGHAFPPASTDAEFIAAVRSLRDNERSWNQSLMRAVIEAVEQADSGSPQTAAAALKAFAASCPWARFAAVATDQASHLEP